VNEAPNDKIPIEMDKVKSESKPFKKYFSRIALGIVCTIALFSLISLWSYFGSISTDYAIIDGQSYLVVAPLDDTLQEIFVNENQFVTQGQIVAKMSLAGNESAVAQDILQNSTLNLNNISSRVESIKKSETDIIARITKLRADETSKNKIVEQKVRVHVQAQLALRNLNAKLALGEKINQNHILAAKNVDKAKNSMEQAKQVFEESSQLRAAIESELMALRRQAMLGKSTRVNKANLYLSTLQKVKALSILRAPAEGKVIMIFAKVGQKMLNQQPILQIIPIAAQTLSVVAYFTEDELEDIKVGQECSISLDLEEQIILQGLVDKVGLGGHSASRNDSSSDSTEEEKLYPIGISLAEGEQDKLKNIYPGTKASVIVHGSKIFGIF